MPKSVRVRYVCGIEARDYVRFNGGYYHTEEAAAADLAAMHTGALFYVRATDRGYTRRTYAATVNARAWRGMTAEERASVLLFDARTKSKTDYIIISTEALQ